jgi:hypothetical protein
VTTTPTPARTAGSTPTARRRRTRVLAVVGAAAATLAVWVVADPLAGVDLTVRAGVPATVQRVGPVAVAIVTVLAGLAGWALLAVLERITPRARSVWTVVAVIALGLSLTGPIGGGTTMASTLALVGMHLAAAAVLIPTLARSAARR